VRKDEMHSDSSSAPITVTGHRQRTGHARVNRRAHAVCRVLLASGRGVANARGLGALSWHRIATLLSEAGDDWLHASERLLAQGTARWMSERLAREEPRGQRA
jgi:hypothetical protein